MNGPTPLQPQGPLILEALRLVEAAQVGESILPTLAGAEVKAVLAEIQAQGLLLLLADGRKLTATGELPYPAGTTLTFRVQPQADGSTQLQPLRADPPLPAPLLAPLVQGEATALLQRLSAPDLPAALLPLKALASRFPAPPPAEGSLPAALTPLAEALGLPTAPEPTAAPPTPAAPAPATPPPQGPQPTRTADLATPLTATLVARGVPPEVAPHLAELLIRGVQEASGKAPSPQGPMRPAEGPQPPAPRLGGSAPEVQAPQGGPSAPPPLTPEALGRLLQATTRVAGAPSATPTDPALPPKVRELMERLPPALAQRLVLLLHLLPPAGQGRPLSPQDPVAQLLKALLPELREALVHAGATPHPTGATPGAPSLDPAQPATWERWLRSTMEALARPEASPQEAPFHRLQAREGTALFELPLPWLADRPQIELWAEREPDAGEGDPTSRVLLALDLGRTGELRVALQAGPGGTRAQVVAGAEVAPELAALLQEELGEPAPFPVQVRSSEVLPPRPRALAGQGLRALG